MKTHSYFGLSLLGHCVIGLMLLSITVMLKPAAIHGLRATNITSPSTEPIKAVVENLKIPSSKVSVMQKQTSRHLVSKQALKPKNNFTAVPANNNTNKENDSKLLTALHNAIATQQSYPESALALQQTGTITLQFNLNPNGHLSQIVIAKSSGSESLDSAALLAAKKVAIVPEARLYLRNEKKFFVDVIYS